MAATPVPFPSMENFAFTLFVYEYIDSEAFNIIFASLNSEEHLILKGAWKTIVKMDGIYGRIFDAYFENLNDDHFLYSKKDFADFVLVRSLDFCESPSFYNFLLVCLFMCRLLQSQPQCLLLVQTAAKCLSMVYSQRYNNFFMENGGLIGMRKYFDDTEEEDLRSVICRHSNSEEEGILIPTFEDVFEIVTEFDEFDVANFKIGDNALEYLYTNYSPFEEVQTARDNLKLSESSLPLNIEGENDTIEFLLEEFDISSEKTATRIQTKCSYCGEKCFKYLMFRVLFRLHALPEKSTE
ncbi:hypothetical protein CDAR_223051 [Caerostris darwini]|uniref:Uncharacterized protein n=1 Tax=Caerostris darwini TaxID=1538125 RepID=A0AAV4SPW9_9ARAC|nr:hypothetical protein CDAR_223051 [Caerostris darwini]